MKNFSDLNLPKSRTIYDCEQVSINQIINCRIEVLGFQRDVKTSFGEGRAVVRIRHEEIEKKFFTNSTVLKDTLFSISPEDFPFMATVKSYKSGKNTVYQFT